MSTNETPWFKRHPGLTLLLVNGGILLAFALVAEIGLRIGAQYNPGYYTSVDVTDTDLNYAYGTIKINSDGYPDEEFQLTSPLRVGYFGDSVTYGVGAGYGYRVSEFLETAYPEYEHLNLGGIGLSVSEGDIRNSARKAEKFGLTDALYLFNLNDILPNSTFTPRPQTWNQRFRSFVRRYLDWLRGRSYLYTYLRTQIKTMMTRQGVGFHGYTAYELNPREHESVLRETAERINRMAATLSELGVRMQVVILPYEMQISDEAETVYAGHGILWEEGFIDRGPQKTIIPFFDPDLPVWDAYYAFVPENRPAQETRERNGVGEFFVYDEGDTLDWNHPNRSGHRAIADYLAQKEVLSSHSE